MQNCRLIHLNGSLSLASEADVFEKVSRIAGPAVRRIPDGETGARGMWIGWQSAKLGKTKGLVYQGQDKDGESYQSRAKLVLEPGFNPEDLSFDDLGYAEEAVRSYAVFSKMKAAGTIAAGTRFQVSMPTPLAVVTAFVAPEAQPDIYPAMEKSFLREAEKICARIPQQELALQWDVAVEFGILEAGFPTYLANPIANIPAQLCRLGNAVPAAVELGYHLCYGNMGLHHFTEPKDTSVLVTVSNAIFAGLKRPVSWISMPVPVARDDADYFKPLADLNPPAQTVIVLGLLHEKDGLEGAKRRMAAAKPYLPEFGIATECGMSQHDPVWTEKMLALHRAASEA